MITIRRLERLERVQPYAPRGELVDVGEWLQRIYGGPYEKCLVRLPPEFFAALERCYGDCDAPVTGDERGAQWN